MIAVIDYGLGNLASVTNALSHLRIEHVLTDNPDRIRRADTLILPGVGAARQGMTNLQARGLDKVIREQVAKGQPLFGICLGMQLLFTASEEGNVSCLNVIPGKVKKFTGKKKIPHVGWNQVAVRNQPPASQMFAGIPTDTAFYFVHSYYCVPEDRGVSIGTTDYEETFCSAAAREHVWGVQFHPEKSAAFGLHILKNFATTYAHHSRN